MNITIKTIPHIEQRYKTTGDWWFEDGNIEIRVSDRGNWKHHALIAVHELVEVLLCKDRCITTSMVDNFDKAFEDERKPGNSDEPGDHPNAPYRKEHFFATNIERLLASELQVEWHEYEAVFPT